MHLKLLIKDGSLPAALEEIELPACVGSEYLTQAAGKKASRQRERQTKARALSVQVHKIFRL